MHVLSNEAYKCVCVCVGVLGFFLKSYIFELSTINCLFGFSLNQTLRLRIFSVLQ